MLKLLQSNILDNLISEELDRFKPVKKSSEPSFSSMTAEQKKTHAHELIEIGETLLGIGRYAPRDPQNGIMQEVTN